MKKYFCLLGALLLVGCSGQSKTIESTTVTELQTEAPQTEPVPATAVIESSSEAVSIPDQDGLVDAIVNSLIDLGATDASLDELIPDFSKSYISIDAVYTLSDGKKIVVHCFYDDMTKHWIANYVDSYDNTDIIYYVYGYDDYYDIYNLRTDELIKESKRAFDESEFMSEAESRFESISDEGNAKLESIAAKYKTK